MNPESYEPPPLRLAEPGSSWSTLAALFPITGQWPIHVDGTDRSGALAIGDESNDLPLLESVEDHPRSLPLALVGVADPADCLAELGWSGAINAGMLGADARVVLKSWQARFGAYVHSAWGGSMEMRVTRPPRTVAEARLVAREHFHFCRYDSQFHGTGGIGPYVEDLVGNMQWRFWWD